MSTFVFAFVLILTSMLPEAMRYGHASKDQSSESVIYSFRNDGSDGTYPVASLIVDKNGVFYGTTNLGGYTSSTCSPAGCGTVFALKPSAHGYTETVIYRFKGGSDGAFPEGSLVEDASGSLYGTTSGSGPSGTFRGSVFKLRPGRAGYSEQTIAQFSSIGMQGSHAALTFGPLGTLFGTAFEGDSRASIVFSLRPSGSGYTLTPVFRTESYISSPLLAGPNDTFLGTTSNEDTFGTVFELAPNVANHDYYSERVLFQFDKSDGADPLSIIKDRRGALFGVTEEGGKYCCGGHYTLGTVFELSPSAKEKVVHFFGNDDGQNPMGGLYEDGSGNLYGTTLIGPNKYPLGVLFKLTPDPDGRRYHILHVFGRDGDGGLPYASLIEGTDHALYGTTSIGGAYDGGVVYRIAI